MYQFKKIINNSKTPYFSNKIKRSAILLTVFAATFFMAPTNCFASEIDTTAAKIVELNQDTDYNFDIDGDGQQDVIKYQSIGKESNHTSIIKLYVNNELAFKKTTDGVSFRVSILDLDPSDKHLNFYIENIAESDCIVASFFAQLEDNKKLKVTAFEPKKLFKDFDYVRYSIQDINDNGEFKLLIDTPMASSSIGCYLCYATFQYKDGKITKIPASYYSLSEGSKEYRYKAVKSFTVQQKAGSKVVAYTVKKGNTLTVDKMYLSKSGKLYFRMVNSKGKKGWIPCDLENLFEQLPAWG